MKNKNILVIAASSQIGLEIIKPLLASGYNVYVTSRSGVELEHSNLFKFHLDICDENSFIKLKDKIKDVEFCSIVNCAGMVISSPVEFLSDSELQKQLDVVLFGLLKIIRHFARKIIKGGKLINLSSMASYGVFPFISPYCLSKSAADILLRSFSNETGIKYVSVRPGAIRTKFWTESIKINEENFKNFTGEYEKCGRFLLANANKNAEKSTPPEVVGKAVVKIIKDKNPKCVVNVGYDAKITAFASRFIPEKTMNKIIKFALSIRSKK